VYFPAVAPPDAFAGKLDVKIGSIAALVAMVAVVRNVLLVLMIELFDTESNEVDECFVDFSSGAKPWMMPMPEMATNREMILTPLFIIVVGSAEG
jgi:hypothetical protein